MAKVRLECLKPEINDCEHHCILETDHFEGHPDLCCPRQVRIKNCNGKYIGIPIGIDYKVLE